MNSEAKELKHISALKAFAGAGLMSAAALSVAVPAIAVAVPLSAVASAGTVELAGSLLAGLGAALWVERRAA